MGLSNAERQRRYRERRRAEQQQAGPAVTSGVTASVTRNEVTGAVSDLPDFGTRGRWLWQQVTDEGPELRPTERVTLEEACRTADRLDQLDRILRGDEDAWMRLPAANEDGSIVKVVLNQALAEARQQQIALKALLAELRTSRAGSVGKPGTGRQPSAPKTGGGGGITDLTARIARRGQAAG